MIHLLRKLFKKRPARPYKLYDTETFYSKYKYGLINSETGDTVMDRYVEYYINGFKQFIIYDDEMQIILQNMKKYLTFYNEPFPDFLKDL